MSKVLNNSAAQPLPNAVAATLDRGAAEVVLQAMAAAAMVPGDAGLVGAALGDSFVLAQAGGLGESARGAARAAATEVAAPADVPVAAPTAAQAVTPVEANVAAPVLAPVAEEVPGANQKGVVMAASTKDDDDDKGGFWWLGGLGLLALGGGGGGNSAVDNSNVIDINQLTGYGTPGVETAVQQFTFSPDSTQLGKLSFPGTDNGDPLFVINAVDGNSALYFSFSYSYVNGVGTATISSSLIIDGNLIYDTSIDGNPTATLSSGIAFRAFLQDFAATYNSNITYNVTGDILSIGEFNLDFSSLDASPGNGNILNSIVVSYDGTNSWQYTVDGTLAVIGNFGEFSLGTDVFADGTSIAVWDPAYQYLGAWTSDTSVLMVKTLTPAILADIDVDASQDGVQIYAISSAGALGEFTVTTTNPAAAFDISQLFQNGNYNVYPV